MQKTREKKAGEKERVFSLHSVANTVLGSLLTVLTLALFQGFNPGSVIRWFGGSTTTDQQKEIQPSPVDFAETIDEGQYIKYGDNMARRLLNWGKDDMRMEKMNLRPDREVFKRTLRLKYRSLVIIHVNAGCYFRVRPMSGNLGMVMTRVSIDGNQHARDNTLFNGGPGLLVPLYSSLGCAKVLEPGEYDLLAEGIFAGCVENNDAEMSLAVLRCQDITYQEAMNIKSGHQWLSASLWPFSPANVVKNVVKKYSVNTGKPDCSGIDHTAVARDQSGNPKVR